MSILSLSEAKEFLRVDQSNEDTLIQVYIDAAGEHIAKFLNLATPPVNAPVKAAAMLIVGDLYENRASQLDKQVYENRTVDALLYPYRENIGI